MLYEGMVTGMLWAMVAGLGLILLLWGAADLTDRLIRVMRQRHSKAGAKSPNFVSDPRAEF